MSASDGDKDIKLIHKGYGYYDRVVSGGDFVVVTGVEAYRAGVRLVLLTRFGELGYNPIFKNFGNNSYLLLKKNKDSLTKVQLQDYTKQALLSMSRTDVVDFVNVEDDNEDPNAWWVEYSVNNGELGGGYTIGESS